MQEPTHRNKKKSALPVIGIAVQQGQVKTARTKPIDQRIEKVMKITLH